VAKCPTSIIKYFVYLFKISFFTKILYLLFPGIIYNNKFYIVDQSYPEVYDGATNTWSKWEAPMHDMGLDACTFVWRDSFFLLGQFKYQKYSLAMKTWSNLITSPPSVLYNPSCIVLPNEEVLVVGSTSLPYQALMYNPLTNTWRKLPNLTNPYGNLVKLGSRVFAVGGNTPKVDEFVIATNSWKSVSFPTLQAHRALGSVLAVPADQFADRPGGCRGV
jgi:hypothetical protein